MNTRCARHAFIAVAFFVAVLVSGTAYANDPPEYTEDGLKRVPNSRVQLAYVAEGADLSIYKKFVILDTHVSFRRHWERDYRTSVSSRDIARIKDGLSALFHEVFVEVLEENHGYPVVTEAGEDVLVLRAAIIDLDVSAPDSMRAGSSRSYSANPGSAKLYLELVDSATGDVVARIIDAKSARRYGTVHIGSNARNSAAARKALREWATLLRGYMDEVHGQAD